MIRIFYKNKIIKRIYLYLIESIIVGFHTFQCIFSFKEKRSLDFIFNFFDTNPHSDKKRRLIPNEQKNSENLDCNSYPITIYMPVDGKQSKYSISLTSLPQWVTETQFRLMCKFSFGTFKTVSRDNSKIPVRILQCVGRVPDINSSQFGLAALSPYSYFFGEKIFPKSKMKSYSFSIIIPYRDQIESTIKCIKNLVKLSSGVIYLELILINNNSKNTQVLKKLVEDILKKNKKFIAKFLDYPFDFNFSSMINMGVDNADYDHIICCNNDVYMASEEWDLKLNNAVNMYPDNVWGIALFNGNKVDSLGIYLRNNLQPVNLFEFQNRCVLKTVYESEYDIINVDAVTGAFMCTSKETFYSSGKFDEKLKVSLNDFLFCVQANTLGYNCSTIMNIEAEHVRSLTRIHDLHPTQRERYMEEYFYSRESISKATYLSNKKMNRFRGFPMRGIFEI